MIGRFIYWRGYLSGSFRLSEGSTQYEISAIGGFVFYVLRVARLSLVPRLDYLDRVQYITHLPISLQRVLFRAALERNIMSFLVI